MPYSQILNLLRYSCDLFGMDRSF